MHRIIRAATSCAAFVAVNAAASGSQLIYEFTGELFQAGNQTGILAGLAPGDAFVVTISVDTSVAPISDGPGMTSWPAEAIRGFIVEFEDRTLVLRDPEDPKFIETGILVFDDYDIGKDALRDNFLMFLQRSDIGSATVDFITTTQQPPGGVIPSLSGLDLPTQEELDPARWGAARLRISSATRGDIHSVRVIPAPPTALFILALGLIARRRSCP